jgi:hypothetical protein
VLVQVHTFDFAVLAGGKMLSTPLTVLDSLPFLKFRQR